MTTQLTAITEELMAELESLATECPWEKIESFDYAAAAGKAYCLDGDGDHLITTFDHRFQRYMEASKAATILSLLQHVRELKVDADRLDWLLDRVEVDRFGVGLPCGAPRKLNKEGSKAAIDKARSATNEDKQ